MNNPNSWLQLALYVGALLLITKPMGLYLMRVLDAKGRTWLDPLVRPVERLTYRLCGIDPDLEQDWKAYTISMLLFSLVGHAVHLLHPALPGPPAPAGAAQSAEAAGPDPAPGLQHRRQLHDQHQLAELHRRGDHVVFLPDGGAGDPQFHLRGDRDRDRGGAGARHRPPHRAHDGQLLGRYGARLPTTCWSRSAWSSRSSWSRRA